MLGIDSIEDERLVKSLFCWFYYPCTKGSTRLKRLLDGWVGGLFYYGLLSTCKLLRIDWKSGSFYMDRLCNLPKLLDPWLLMESFCSNLNPFFSSFNIESSSTISFDSFIIVSTTAGALILIWILVSVKFFFVESLGFC